MAGLTAYDGPHADEIEREFRRLLGEIIKQKTYEYKAVGFLRNMILDSGYKPGVQAGTINDFSIPWRLRLVIKANLSLALGHKRWKGGFNEGAYDAFPAAELIFEETGVIDEDFWGRRWAEAGGKIYDGRRIAMLADPVWQRVSVYGLPWMPFDCIGATGQNSVSISEVEELHVTWTEAMEFFPRPSTALFFFRDLPEWLGEWKTLQSLVLDA